MSSSQIIVLHIPLEHIEFVSRKGLSPLQINSWRKELLSKSALKKLILANENSSPSRFRLKNISVTIQLPKEDNSNNELVKYFWDFFSFSFNKGIAEVKSAKISELRFVINLMPFSFPTSISDKIIKGLRKYLENEPKHKMKRLHLTFLTKNSLSFQDSLFYKDTINNKGKYNVTFHLIDYRGYSCEDISRTRKPISRELFKKSLVNIHRKQTEEEWFYSRLIYETNTYIGHFLLPNSHVRTHYDLKDFVREDNIFEYLYSAITKIITGFSNVLLIYDGIESTALQRLSSQLQQHCDHINAIADFQRGVHRKDLASADAIIILTDIVNTGRSLKSAYDYICSMQGKKVNVICFSIIAMQNSPEDKCDISFLTASRVRREYYKNDPKQCVLCLLEQPSIEVRQAKDFEVVHPRQLTPFDFWEMVYDTKAMKQKEMEITGRILSYRVESVQIIKRYGNWLRNVINKKYLLSLPNRFPTKVLTVKEQGGIAFSNLICDALNISHTAVMPILREELRRLAMPNSRAENPGLLAQDRVLLADDGINEGNTIRQLANYCNKYGADPIGVVVLDNRLEEQDFQKLRTKLGRVPIIFLYGWPGKVLHHEMIEGIDGTVG